MARKTSRNYATAGIATLPGHARSAGLLLTLAALMAVYLAIDHPPLSETGLGKNPLVFSDNAIRALLINSN